MTFRAKPVVTPGRQRRESGERRNLYLNLAFGAVVIIAVLILAGAAAASWYADHWAAMASVNGQSISKDQYRAALAAYTWRLTEAESNFRDQGTRGLISSSEADQRIQQLQSQAQQLPDTALESMIDNELQRQIAAKDGVTVTDQQVEDQLKKEAQRPEYRESWVITIQPELSADATTPTKEQTDAARQKADRLLADLKGGKDWTEVAKESSDSSASQGGAIGYLTAESGVDKVYLDAILALQANQITDVLTLSDGSFAIGRVTNIVAASEDAQYVQKIQDAGVSLDVYKGIVRAEVTKQALEDYVLNPILDGETPQRRVQEIFLAATAGQDVEQVKVRHILYSPKGDPQGASALATDDPAWAEAEAKARATYEELKTDPAKFAEIAVRDSNDTGTKDNGGDLPYYAQADLDPAFGTAIFADGLQKDQILEPVKSAFGWHVIQFVGRRGPASQRIDQLAEQARAAGADFGQLAKDNSEGAEASDGGDLGWVARYQLATSLEDVVFGTAVGAVSTPIQSTDGYYLFKINEEATRKVDATQVDAIKANGFTAWYQPQKDAADIVKYVQPAALTVSTP